MSPRTPLVRPTAYFDAHTVPFVPGLLVFGLHLVGQVVTFFALVQLFFAHVENLSPEGRRALSGALFEVLGPFVFFFVLVSVVALTVIAAVMHYGSSGPGTAGSFDDAVGVAGWAYAPNVFAIPVMFLLGWNHVRSLSLDGSEPRMLVAQVEALQQPGGLGVTLVTLVVVAWSVYILAEGTAGTHEVDRDRTIGPALLVGVGTFLLSLL